MFADLVPEWFALMLTPLALVGTAVLLGTAKPLPDALSFAGAFAVSYGVFAFAGFFIGDVAAGSTGGTGRDVISLVLGILFLGFAVAVAVRPRPKEPRAPIWLHSLQTATPGKSFATGAALALVNPNLAILISGIAIVVTSEETRGIQLLGVLSLVVAALVPLALPIVIYLALGSERGGPLLAQAVKWMAAHDRQITIGTMLLFAIVFGVRGLNGLT